MTSITEALDSEIRTMSIECERVGGINLSQGVCDTDVPVPVAEGAIAAILAGVNTYTRHDGLAALRTAIAGKLARDNGLTVDAETEVVVTAGSTGAFYCACCALLSPGDEVIVLEPFYGYHVNTLVAVQAVPVPVPLAPPDWSFDVDAVERAVTSRTRAILINTPGNPSGKLFSRQDLEALGSLAARHDLIVFSDEIYEYFVYDGCEHISPASLPALAGRTVIVSGYSKTFSITGWRIGYAVCRADWAERIGHFSDLVYVCAPAPLQLGVARGIEELGPEYYAGLRTDYAAKRDVICDALRAGGLTPFVPKGAYYVLADASRVPGESSRERARALLKMTGVASVPGDSFFHAGRGELLLRFCFAKRTPVLADACARLAAARP